MAPRGKKHGSITVMFLWLPYKNIQGTFNARLSGVFVLLFRFLLNVKRAFTSKNCNQSRREGLNLIRPFNAFHLLISKRQKTRIEFANEHLDLS